MRCVGRVTRIVFTRKNVSGNPKYSKIVIHITTQHILINKRKAKRRPQTSKEGIHRNSSQASAKAKALDGHCEWFLRNALLELFYHRSYNYNYKEEIKKERRPDYKTAQDSGEMVVSTMYSVLLSLYVASSSLQSCSRFHFILVSNIHTDTYMQA